MLDRIRHLITLAGDPRTPRHEAENAAVAACRLIGEHGVELREHAPAPAPLAPVTRARRRKGPVYVPPTAHEAQIDPAAARAAIDDLFEKWSP